MTTTCSPLQQAAIALVVLGCTVAAHAQPGLDFSGAAVLAPGDSSVVQTARRMFIEEAAARTGSPWPTVAALPDDATPIILLTEAGNVPAALRTALQPAPAPPGPEGYTLYVAAAGPRPVAAVIGHDAEGVLFGAGRLLLMMRLEPGRAELAANTVLATAPRYPHRGHQIGFRNLSHSYDAWTPEVYEQYMRELALFGANAFETTPFQDPDQMDGPHAKVSKGEMAAAWSRICADYGFDFWMFSGAPGGTGESPAALERSIADRLDMLRAIPHLDHIYLTGGDGQSEHRRPDLMFEAIGQFAVEARKIHPGLGIWTSNQGFDPEQNNWFFNYLQQEQPEWLTGIVYGAWNRIFADEQRARTPAQYPIRRYNDIGHCVRAQYPVAGWDRALARTLGREPFAPRPHWQARIHNLFDEYADGFVTYSDGIGDDVNKVVWTALGWDPDRSVDDILLDYARFHFGWDIAEPVRDGLVRFEQHFEGPLAENDLVAGTFALWRGLEEQASEALLANWRFQSCLLRAYYDHYTRLRLLKANAIEERALAALRAAPERGAEAAIREARAILAESDQDAETDALKARILELGAQLYESIGAQLDVETYQARNAERGAILEFLDTPLNNARWLEHEFDAILAGRLTASMPEQPSSGDVRVERLLRVANWEDPGPGGFYDDLGCAWKQPRLLKPHPLWDDPAGIATPREGHLQDNGEPYRLSWFDSSEALNQAPLVLRYEGLDPAASYRVRTTYLGRYNATVRLVANGEFEIHGAYGHTLDGVRYTIDRDSAADFPHGAGAGREVVPLEFPIPREATADGTLELRWQRMTGRGSQVAEVWLIKE